MAERAAAVVHVPGGLVEVVAAALRPDVTGRRLVALGGGRVIDVAKALAAADGPREVLAIPTSLSAAEMTRVHRHAEGVPGDTPRVRPGVVVNDPALSASLPADALAAGSANALAHATVGLLSDRATPIGRAVARDAMARFVAGWSATGPDRPALALGALLAGWAVDQCGLGPHHALAQTAVRTAGVAHAYANAALLPATIGALRARRPAAFEPAGRPSWASRSKRSLPRAAGPRRGRRPRRDRDGRCAARPGGPGGAATPGARPRRARARRRRAPRHLPRRRRAPA